LEGIPNSLENLAKRASSSVFEPLANIFTNCELLQALFRPGNALLTNYRPPYNTNRDTAYRDSIH
jgi:hypothetical protein